MVASTTSTSGSWLRNRPRRDANSRQHDQAVPNTTSDAHVNAPSELAPVGDSYTIFQGTKKADNDLASLTGAQADAPGLPKLAGWGSAFCSRSSVTSLATLSALPPTDASAVLMFSNASTACARNPCAGIDIGQAGDKDETMRTVDLHRWAKLIRATRSARIGGVCPQKRELRIVVAPPLDLGVPLRWRKFRLRRLLDNHEGVPCEPASFVQRY